VAMSERSDSKMKKRKHSTESHVENYNFITESSQSMKQGNHSIQKRPPQEREWVNENFILNDDCIMFRAIFDF
jgi:hypothetical protein